MLGNSRRGTRTPLLLASLVLVAWTDAGAYAGEVTLRARYSLSYMGMRVGQLAITTRVGPSSYDTEVETSLSGVATFAAPYDRMRMKATGLLRGGAVIPSSFSASQIGETDSRSLRVSLKAGNATSVEMKPPVDDRDARIPLTEEHKRNVVDPASALLMTVLPGEDGVAPASCDRTLRLFGGFFRSDLTLSFVRTEEFVGAGYFGPVGVCSGRYVPIAGHRPDGAMTRFMLNSGIELRLAAVHGAPIMLLVLATVPMPLGTVRVEVEEYGFEPTPSGSH